MGKGYFKPDIKYLEELEKKEKVSIVKKNRIMPINSK